ncbi:MAG: lipocalin-like domain-containing protein [Pseudohongiellaceae bacterium]
MDNSLNPKQIWALTVISFFVFTGAATVAAEDLDLVKARFIGDWELVSYFNFPEPGGERDMGYIGTLRYDEFDNMSGVGMPVDLPQRAARSNERITAGFAYWGKVEYDLAKQRVIHHVEGSPMVPAWVGGENIRYYEFVGDYLKLSLHSDSGRTTGTLTWRKHQAPPGLQQAADEAVDAVHHFIAEWNTGNIERVRQTLNYPHITHGANGLTIANAAGEFVQDFDLLRRQGWTSSRIDRVDTYQVSADKVHLGMWYSRLNSAGEVYQPGYVFYVFTRKDGRWGMQYRAPSGIPGQFDAAALQSAREQASAAVHEFFVGFNAADNSALRQVHHVPQVMMNQNGYVLATDSTSPIVTTNFAALRQNENWGSSSIAVLNPLSVTPNQVIFEIVFERFDAAGEKYRSVPGIWVLSKRDEHWGLEYRSLLTPTYER